MLRPVSHCGPSDGRRGQNRNVDAKTVASTRTELAQLMTPNDANVLGKVFGGSILAMIDLTASATAQKFAGHVCVTASFDRVDFHLPINIGDLVTMVGTVTYAGRTSLEIAIEVVATNLTRGEDRQSNSARVTMVAIDADGRPTPVPKLVCETMDEKRRYLEGRVRRELRVLRLAENETYKAKVYALDEPGLDRLMAAPSALEALGSPGG